MNSSIFAGLSAPIAFERNSLWIWLRRGLHRCATQCKKELVCNQLGAILLWLWVADTCNVWTQTRLQTLTCAHAYPLELCACIPHPTLPAQLTYHMEIMLRGSGAPSSPAWVRVASASACGVEMHCECGPARKEFGTPSYKHYRFDFASQPIVILYGSVGPKPS